MKTKLLFICLCLQSLNSFACLDANQHKLFPIGIINNNLIFIEAHLHRTHDLDKNGNDGDLMAMKWIITSYVSIYDKQHNLISQTEIENSEIRGRSYLPLLQSMYSKGLFQIKSIYRGINYFSVDYLSFCDYQKKCERLEIQHDTIAKKDTFKYNKQDFAVELTEDQKDQNSAIFISNLSYYYINSVRVYTSQELELVIAHLATGHEVSMGWINDNLDKKTNEFENPVHEAKPYQPNFEFKELYTAVYEEPIMHHGYGFDLFIISEN